LFVKYKLLCLLFDVDMHILIDTEAYSIGKYNIMLTWTYIIVFDI